MQKVIGMMNPSMGRMIHENPNDKDSEGEDGYVKDL
jgi:hypothetical protein